MRRVPNQTALVALGLLALAGVLGFRAWNQRDTGGTQTFFYDLSAQRIFTASQHSPPPIRGVDGPEADAYRAVVFSPTGQPQNRKSWQVAYLEKFTPELQEKMSAAQSSGEPLAMGRLEAQSHRLVRRPNDTDWHPMNSPQAEVILQEWTRTGSDPVLCTP